MAVHKMRMKMVERVVLNWRSVMDENWLMRVLVKLVGADQLIGVHQLLIGEASCAIRQLVALQAI